MAPFGRDSFTIARPTGVCAATGEPIQPGDRFVACLVEAQDGALERRDFSAQAWEAGSRPDSPPIGFWHATMPQADDSRQAFIDDASLCDLFEQLETATEPRRIAFRYVLALILVRKRLLHLAASKPHEITVQWTRRSGRMTAPSQGEEARMAVRACELDDASIEGLAEQFEAILGEESA